MVCGNFCSSAVLVGHARRWFSANQLCDVSVHWCGKIFCMRVIFLRKVQQYLAGHTVSHVTLLVSSGKFMSGSAFFLSPPENKKAKFAFCTLKRKGGSTQKQPFLTVRFRGALLTKSVTLEFSQDTVCKGNADVSSLFLLQLLGTQIGLNWVGLWNSLQVY